MPESWPSSIIIALDVPEVKIFDAKFSYNFFTPDEKINDRGDLKAQGASSTVEEIERQLSKRSPRFVKFSFSPVDVKTNTSVDNEFVVSLLNPTNVRRMIHDNLDKIQSELDVSTNAFSALNAQDGNISNKTSRLLDLSVDMRVEMEGSVVDRAKVLNNTTSPEVDGESILKLMGNSGDSGVNYVGMGDKKIIEKPMEGMSKINMHAQFNDKFVASILRRAAASHGPLAGEISSILNEAVNKQNTAKQSVKPHMLTENEFSIKIDPIDIRVIDASKFRNAAKIVGYIIDKNEILATGRRVKRDPVIIERAYTTAAVDSKVRYGGKYEYSIRSIALVQLQSIDEETGQMYATTGLISSKPSSFKVVTCLEFNPPPPPADFNFVWDYQKNDLVIMWSFPAVPTRDIKRFQVFRRRTVSDPFTLLIEYDFDDSVIKTPRSETPRSSRVIRMNSPKTTYTDPEFNKDSTYIYALCCVDSHDFTSNYSEQFSVSFDRFKNKMVKELISPSGAPKPYPNFYLREDVEADVGSTNLTVDSIKVSGHDKMTIFFDPEYLSIVKEDNDGNESDLDLLTTEIEGGKYKMQFINIDRQIGKVLNISVEDLRTS